MNKYLKRTLFIVGALLYYFASSISFASVILEMNLISGWTFFFTLVAHQLIVGPTILIIIYSIFGELDNWGIEDEDEINEDLLVHAVINQLETDFGVNDFESMDDYFKP